MILMLRQWLAILSRCSLLTLELFQVGCSLTEGGDRNIVPRISILSITTFGATLKNEVYSTTVTNVDELWERIVATFDAIRNRPGQLERVRESMMRRLNRCVAANGQHFEHLM